MYIYDLMATVVHILDSRTGGSLVGHIKVGETYHQRKEVRPCRTPLPTFPEGSPPFLGLSAGCWNSQEAAGAPGREGRAEEKKPLPTLGLVPPGPGHGASLSLHFQVRAGDVISLPEVAWAVLVRAGGARSCQSLSKPRPWPSYLLHLPGVLLGSWAEPVQPNPVSSPVTTQGSRDFPTVSLEGRGFPHGTVTPSFPC